MVHRASLAPFVTKDAVEKNRRRSADARLTSDAKGSSLETPFVIDSDDEKDYEITVRSGPSAKSSPRTLRVGTGIKSTVNLQQNNSPPYSVTTKNQGHGDRTLMNKAQNSPNPGARKHVSYCGNSYTRLGNLKNHESTCDKCKKEQNKENTASNDQKELPDRINKVSTKTPRTSGANELLDKGLLFDDISRNDYEANHAQMKTAQDNSNSTQILSCKLSMMATRNLSSSDEKGYVYIFRDPETGHLKIGFAGDPTRRAQEHEKCGRNLEVIHISRCILWARRAENLIRSDLKHLSKPWFCFSCRKVHGEYFKITEERAKEIVKRWTEWIGEFHPYAADRSLTPLWKYLILFGRPPKKEIETHDHEARWAHWDWILSKPSVKELEEFKTHDSKFGTDRNGEKAPQRQRMSDGASYLSRETLDTTNKNNSIDPAIAEIFDQAAEAVAEKLRGKKHCMTPQVTFHIEYSLGQASVCWMSH